MRIKTLFFNSFITAYNDNVTINAYTWQKLLKKGLKGLKQRVFYREL